MTKLHIIKCVRTVLTLICELFSLLFLGWLSVVNTTFGVKKRQDKQSCLLTDP